MPGRMVYRPVVGRVCAAGFAAFAGWWLVAAVTGPHPTDAVVLAPALLAAGAAVYGVLWRPAVVIDEAGVLLVNVLRDVHVPWAGLEGIETRYALTLLAGGRRFQSWAAAAPGRPSLAGRLVQGPGARSVGSGAGTAVGHDHRLPDPRWGTSGITPDRASRDLRGDSGAAAFMVEQAWTAWQERAHGATTTGDVRVRLNVALATVTLVAAAAAVLLGVLRG